MPNEPREYVPTDVLRHLSAEVREVLGEAWLAAQRRASPVAGLKPIPLSILSTAERDRLVQFALYFHHAMTARKEPSR